MTPDHEQGRGTSGGSVGRERPATAAIHAGAPPRVPGGAVAPELVRSSTFLWSDPADGPLLYTRYANNPTLLRVAAKMAALERTEASIALASGMAAVATTLWALLEHGDHVVASSRLYGASHALLRSELPRRGVEVDFIDPLTDDWEAALRPRTKVLYLETPTNPTLRIPDPREAVRVARAHGLRVVCDATFASPVNLRAAALGVDVVIHSATKYLGGHSDLTAGVASGPAELVERITEMAKLYGPTLDPQAAWLLDRGLRTLEVRVERQNRSALELARRLEALGGVADVVHPGLPSHPDHARATELLAGYGGMLGVVLEGGGEVADRFVRRLRVAVAAPSLGGVETLVSQPRHTSHANVGMEERAALGIPDGFVRVSVGLEDVDDLFDDFAEALA